MPMKSTPSGSSLSLCHTIAGLRPVTSSMPVARSRSQFEPGKTITALFMSLHVLQPLNPEVLDHRVGEQFPAHVLDVGIARAIGKVELDQFAGADIVHARKAEPLERVMDGLALRVENAGLEGDEHARFHRFACRMEWWQPYGRALPGEQA